jgi:2-dehydro-3-deoxyphosphooctonate aldolase (KDO 8-P synthase)
MKPTIIAGPCSMESPELMHEVATELKVICEELGFKYIFKSSYDKANRSSINSFRGPGLQQGLKWLAEIKSSLGIPVTTDVHESNQVEAVASVADVIQIPALLSRQTDLILAAAQTGLPTNIKKGQFMAPNDVGNVVAKFRSSSEAELIITERGTAFGYNNLVVDFRSLITMRKFGAKIGYDATHSIQRPVANGQDSGGDPELIPYLAGAAALIGVDYLFLETHPNSAKALSDGACMLETSKFKNLLMAVNQIDRAKINLNLI